MPLAAVDAGASTSTAGFTVGSFMAATVLAQLGTPMLLSRFDFRPIMIAGCGFLGLPCLALLVTAGSVTSMTIVSAARGVGFGLLTVSSSALLPHLVPHTDRGRFLGVQGACIGAVQAISLPLGLHLYQVGGVALVAVVACASNVGVSLALLRVPSVIARESSLDEAGSLPPDEAGSLPPAITMSRLTLACVCIASAGSTYGAVVALLPLPDSPQSTRASFMLAVVPIATILGRLVGGRTPPSSSTRTLSIAALCCAAGLGALPIVGISTGVLQLIAAALSAAVFGLGLGLIMNISIVVAFASVPDSRLGVASAAWNFSFDAGIGSGSAIAGIAVDTTSFSNTYIAFALLAGSTAAAPILFRHRRAHDAPSGEPALTSAPTRTKPSTNRQEDNVEDNESHCSPAHPGPTTSTSDKPRPLPGSAPR